MAFGLGARTAVSNILASYYLQKTYTPGHNVRIGEIEGEIIQITPTAVVLATPEGRTLVPPSYSAKRLRPYGERALKMDSHTMLAAHFAQAHPLDAAGCSKNMTGRRRPLFWRGCLWGRRQRYWGRWICICRRNA